jgi:SAM-dependent methyltransferase
VHQEAYEWIARHATDEAVDVIDFGGRDVNGTARPLFPNATSYTVLDILPGPNVDIVADAASWDPDGRRFGWAIAAEIFEHTHVWPVICRTAYRALRPGGRLIVTTAGHGRPVHSGVDGGPVLHPGEWYANVDPERLRIVLELAGFVDVEVDVRSSPSDVRAVATRPT